MCVDGILIFPTLSMLFLNVCMHVCILFDFLGCSGCGIPFRTKDWFI